MRGSIVAGWRWTAWLRSPRNTSERHGVLPCPMLLTFKVRSIIDLRAGRPGSPGVTAPVWHIYPQMSADERR